MSYHIEVPRSGFKELPDRILVREDGYLGAYKFYGEPIVDYWYVPEQRMTDTEREALTRRIDELCQENEWLRAANAAFTGRSIRAGDKMACLEAENAKLQEFLQDLADHIKSDDGFGLDRGWLLDRLRELGVVK